MATSSWLDDVQKRLLRQGLPPSYVQRFMEELTDHLDDLKGENMEGDKSSKLGDPEQVADNAVAAYRRRSSFGRHPVARFLVFGVSPFVTPVALFVVSVCLIGLVAALCERLGLLSNEGRLIPNGPVEHLLSVSFSVIPAILTTVAYCKLAKWLGIARTWMVVSCVVLAAMAIPCWCVNFRLANHSVASCNVGLWIPGWGAWCPLTTIRSLIQPFVPLAIGWWFLRRKHDQGQLQLAA